MYLKFRATAFLLFLFSYAFSQDYMIMRTLSLNDSKALVSLQYNRKNYGCGILNARGILEGEMPIEGVPFGLAKLGAEYAMIFYTESTKMLSHTTAIHAVLIDIGKKKIIKDNIIFKNPGKNELGMDVICDPSGNFLSLMVRISEHRPSISAFGPNPSKRKKTEALINVTVDRNLTPTETPLKSNVLNGELLGTSGGKNGEFFICSYGEEQLVAEWFDSKGSLKNKLAVNSNIKLKPLAETIFQYDSLTSNCIDLAIAFEEQKNHYVQLMRFDFKSNKSLAAEKVNLNKDYVRSLRDGTDDSKLKNFGEIYNLFPVQLIETADKIILVKEIQSQMVENTSLTRFRGGSIISTYSKDLKLLSETAIDKWSAFNMYSYPAISVYPRNEKLYIITNVLTFYNKVL